ncbi:MAG: nicotinamide mononucleotide transporter [Colwellia sp.]|nr:nicotinamide mononucleotide transporter [Colwellia sp.]
MSLSTEIISYFSALPWLELVAMFLALAYVILAAQGSLWCWPVAFISTALYTIVFYDVLLLMDSALNVYYLIMAVYGYWAWTKNTSNNREQNNQQETTHLAIVSWQVNCHVKACLLLTLISMVLGYVMANYTPAAFPYLDTFTTVFAVFATYLVTQKVLENWLYWIIIDFISIYLYVEKGLMPTATLFIIYVFIAGYGYVKWQKLYKSHPLNLTQTVES